MKTNYLLLLCLLIAACNNTNKPANQSSDSETQLQCSTANDAVLMGYKGKVKKVIERRFVSHDSNGVADKEAFITIVIDFDSTGQVTECTHIGNGGRDIESKLTYSHTNGITTAIHSQSSYKELYLTDDVIKRGWTNETTFSEMHMKLYHYNGNDTILKGDSTVYTLDKQCRTIERTKHFRDNSIQHTKTTLYKYTGDSVCAYSLKADSDKELNYISVIQEKDSFGNPTKVLYPEPEGHQANLYTYTYEYY